ncbi:MAG: glycosyltransferase family 2 protein [Saprospiraceae bacterium]|nr:glycosyltransferase family 2 protein [Saprospiraceae bacterium]
MDRELVVIIPIYNESYSIVSQLVRSILDLNLPVILVDDGSSDSYNYEGINGASLIKHSKNFGQGTALVTGMKKALEDGFMFCVHFDSDGQHDTSDILKMYNTIKSENADIVLGSRFLPNVEKSSMTIIRKIVLKIGVIINYLICGLMLTDSNNGFRLMNRKTMEILKLRSAKMAHASEIIWLVAWNKLKFSEFGINVKYTQYSLSKGQPLYKAISVFFEICRTLKSYKFGD